MIIELKGGPFDGEVLGTQGDAPYFLVAAGHPERPVYRCSCCACCAAKEEIVEYLFAGYEHQLKKFDEEQEAHDTSSHHNSGRTRKKQHKPLDS